MCTARVRWARSKRKQWTYQLQYIQKGIDRAKAQFIPLSKQLQEVAQSCTSEMTETGARVKEDTQKVLDRCGRDAGAVAAGQEQLNTAAAKLSENLKVSVEATIKKKCAQVREEMDAAAKVRVETLMKGTATASQSRIQEVADDAAAQVKAQADTLTANMEGIGKAGAAVFGKLQALQTAGVDDVKAKLNEVSNNCQTEITARADKSSLQGVQTLMDLLDELQIVVLDGVTEKLNEASATCHTKITPHADRAVERVQALIKTTEVVSQSSLQKAADAALVRINSSPSASTWETGRGNIQEIAARLQVHWVDQVRARREEGTSTCPKDSNSGHTGSECQVLLEAWSL
jgi:hypothetical protein